MHGEITVLAGAAAGFVSWVVATALDRADIIRDRLPSLPGRGGT